jgi:hypothetical protein
MAKDGGVMRAAIAKLIARLMGYRKYDVPYNSHQKAWARSLNQADEIRVEQRTTHHLPAWLCKLGGENFS